MDRLRTPLQPSEHEATLSTAVERGKPSSRATPRKRVRRHSVRYIFSHRDLLLRVTWNDIGRRYAGSLLGIGWVVIGPVALLGLYATVYRVIFRVQLPGLGGWLYVLYIFAGLVPYLMTAEALSSGVGSVVVNRAVLNNTVFPIDLAPVKAVLAAQGSMLVGMIGTIGGVIILGHASWTLLLVPVVWALQLMALVGIGWILSLVNVVVRDVQNLIAVILVMVMVASPIAYTPSMVPASLKAIIYLNPFAYFVLTYQDIIVRGQLPDPITALVLVTISVGLFAVGGWFFSRSKYALIDYV
jgi:lipopolysaccharide transport system permease protein